MSERITELMMEAGRTIPGDKHIDADFCNQFAKLIIWECVESLSEVDDSYMAVFQSHLLEHFGIEQ